ncbi:hypothetical protein [Alcanivorax sp.]|uniref:hypothetical protein n=1 Tax=Alcanivorax sp. TaxID=1872427 RepID=UPI000C0EDA15|nr:hypothetical protein [Alcanivorax sp.]PHR65239.1 MAG: hypothetical protein COA55_11710 [Alcanivorax sp.]
MFKKTALSLAVLALAACGGGGGSSSGGGGGGSTSASTEGTASKGIISGALVEAHKANGDLIGTATTAEDGSYSIDLGNYNGAVQLILKQPEGGGALVTCDVASCGPAGPGDISGDDDNVDFGEQYALDYELRSVVHVDSSASTVSAHITPLTTLVADKAGVGADQAAVAAANSFVKNMLGLDANPSEVKPVDLTNATEGSDQELRFALLNAAIEEQAQNSVSDVTTVLGDLSANFAANQVDKGALDGLVGSIAKVETAVSNGNGALDVASAASGAENNAQSAIDEACATGGGEEASESCSPKVELDGELGDNLEKAKALVATARKVSIEALESVDAELNEESEGYNPDNLIVKISNVADDVDTDTRKVVQAFGEVAGVLVDQIVRGVIEEESLTTDLVDAASLYYEASYDNDCEFYPLEMQAQCNTDYEEDKAEFVSHFVGGTVSRTDNDWSVSSATFDLDGDDGTVGDQVSVNLGVTLPTVAGDGETGIGLNAGVNTLSIDGLAAIPDVASFTVNEGSSLVVELNNTFIADDESEPEDAIKRVALDVSAELTNNELTFNGGVEVVVRESSKQKSLNTPMPEILLPMPEKLALNGKFEEAATGNSLDANVLLTVSNASQFGFYQEGLERDLVSYSYDEENNALSVTIGSGENQAEVAFSLEETVNGEGESWEWSEFTITSECISTSGDASCPANNEYWVGGYNVVAEGVDSEEACADPEQAGSMYTWWHDDSQCIAWIDSQHEDFDSNIRNFFTADADWYLDGMRAYVTGEGWYQVGPDDFYDDYAGTSLFPADGDTAVAHLDESDMDFDAEGRYLTGTLRVETAGKLSANLPEMDVKLVATRTGYELGEATLDLAWDGDSLKVVYPYSGEGSRTVTLEDGEGTVMTVEFDDSAETATGEIRKDGTVYGTFRDENGQYIITWIDNTIESLY